MPRSRTAVTQLAQAAPVFAALGDEVRLRIVSRLCEEGPLSIVRLTQGSTISRQAVTKHLHALSAAGLVLSARSGRERIWQLETRRLAEVRRYIDQISTQWDRAIDRLRAFVEDGNT
jgi:DNA-binding transcriptional ArsR family regulator